MLFITIAAVYLTSFLPRKYVVSTTIFTGIASGSSLEEEGRPTWDATTNAFDNIINLVKARSTLETVSIRLYAQDMIYGSEKEDTKHITAENYRKLLKISNSVLPLIDKKSEDKTVENLLAYREENPDNFIYQLFNKDHPHYSYDALRKIVVKRLGTSDMLEISYQSDDPGITLNTVKLLTEELIKSYELIRFGASNDVIKYFEEQLAKVSKKLRTLEDSLMYYNMENRIINYDEQTKSLTILNSEFETHYQNILLDYNSSGALLKQLESKMDTRALLLKENSEFIQTLDEISSLTGKITEIETFSPNVTEAENERLREYKDARKKAEKKIASNSTNMDIYKYSKEGVAIDDMVQKWLTELIKHEKTGTELKVMKQRKEEIDNQYSLYSPVGPNLKRREREIRVTEESYLELMHGLSLARLKQKNIQLTSASLNIVAPPHYPISSDSRKRGIYIIATLLFSFMFMCGYLMLLEFLDKTIRDANRAKRLTKGNILGVFPGKGKLKYRGYDKACMRIAGGYACNALNNYLNPDKTTIFNLISIEPGEGKTYISEILTEHWENLGFSVKRLSYHDDFIVESKDFLHASSIYKLYHPTDTIRPNILLVEYPNLQSSNIPTALLQEAATSLLILNARRAWKESDQYLLNKIQKQTGAAPLFIYLNKAEREAVEEFTGQLPPYTRVRKFIYKIFQFGLTAEDIQHYKY